MSTEELLPESVEKNPQTDEQKAAGDDASNNSAEDQKIDSVDDIVDTSPQSPEPSNEDEDEDYDDEEPPKKKPSRREQYKVELARQRAQMQELMQERDRDKAKSLINEHLQKNEIDKSEFLEQNGEKFRSKISRYVEKGFTYEEATREALEAYVPSYVAQKNAGRVKAASLPKQGQSLTKTTPKMDDNVYTESELMEIEDHNEFEKRINEIKSKKKKLEQG